MFSDLIALTLSAVLLLTLMRVADLGPLRFRLSEEVLNSLSYAGAGVIVSFMLVFVSGPGPLYVLAVLLLLVSALRLRGRGGKWHSGGTAAMRTFAFGLTMFAALAVTWSVDSDRVFAFQVGFLVPAIAGPSAFAIGDRRSWSRHLRVGRTRRTIASVVFFVVAVLVMFLALMWFQGLWAIDWAMGDLVLAVLMVGVVTAVVYFLGGRDWGPALAVIATIILLVHVDEHEAARSLLAGALVAGLVFGVVAYRLRFLDLSGAVAGGLFGASIIGVGGWAWAVPAFTFFVLSSLLSRVGRGKKEAVEVHNEKGSRRDVGQVLANGGIAWALLLAHALLPATWLYWGFLGAFAAATADTWATELGVLSRSTPRLITTGRRVPRGSSGAVSATGTAAAVLGAAVIWASAWLASPAQLAGAGISASLLIVTGAGLLGAMVDSLAGATIQARFRDPVTGMVTERAVTEHGAAELIGGRNWIRNDVVNALCTITGALAAMACFPLVDFASYPDRVPLP